VEEGAGRTQEARAPLPAQASISLSGGKRSKLMVQLESEPGTGFPAGDPWGDPEQPSSRP
jgi:hypothetical protein